MSSEFEAIGNHRKISKAFNPRVAVIMGSQSDWPTMLHAVNLLEDVGVENEALIVSAHRTPDRLYAFARNAADLGFKVIIAGAGGAAHLPGMVASMTKVPVLGVPIQSKSLDGMDSLLSIVQMPGGVPVGTLAIGKAGAINAALLAAQIIALQDQDIAKNVDVWRQNQSLAVPETPMAMAAE